MNELTAAELALLASENEHKITDETMARLMPLFIAAAHKGAAGIFIHNADGIIPNDEIVALHLVKRLNNLGYTVQAVDSTCIRIGWGYVDDVNSL